MDLETSPKTVESVHKNNRDSIESGIRMLEKYGLVLTIREIYWWRFCRLSKAGKITHAYVLGGVVFTEHPELVFFYSTHPFKEVIGYARILQCIVNDSQKLWDSYGEETCLKSYDEYIRLTRGKDKVTFIRFASLYEASNYVSFGKLSALLSIERMPQIGIYITKEQADQLIELLNKPENFR